MTYIQINDTLIPATVSGKSRDPEWDYRHTQDIHCSFFYEEAKATFVDGLEWYLVYQDPSYINEAGDTVTPEPIVYDKTQFDLVMSITENRDGTVTVKMGETTAEEALAILTGGT